jgi:hypothetical protein
VYGEYTNAFVLDHLDVVEVVLTNNDGGSTFDLSISLAKIFRLIDRVFRSSIPLPWS